MRYLKAVAFLVLIFPLHPTFAQLTSDRLTYIKENAIVINNVEPLNENYTDLALLKSTLQDVEIIGLGEQTHHDGNTFKAKTRLVKFLHQEMGFRVIAFESGFYDCYKAWQEIKSGKTTLEAAKKSVYPFWINSETEELFRYIDQQKNTDKPLILAGIDCKFSGTYAEKDLLHDFKDYLKKVESVTVQDTAKWTAFSAALERIVAVSDYLTKPSSSDTLILNTDLKSILEEVKGKAALDETDWQEHLFWRQFMHSTLTEVSKRYAKEQVRDRQMGDNLEFLQKELYPGEKVIIWAASSHLTYTGANIEREFYQQNLRLGDYIKQSYGDKYYNIGFTGYKGKIGKLLFFPLINVKKHQPNSIEYVLGQTKQPYLFLNLNKTNLPEWLKSPLVARPFGYKEIRMRLPNVMDGLFYTEEIFEKTPIQNTIQ